MRCKVLSDICDELDLEASGQERRVGALSLREEGGGGRSDVRTGANVFRNGAFPKAGPSRLFSFLFVFLSRPVNGVLKVEDPNSWHHLFVALKEPQEKAFYWAGTFLMHRQVVLVLPGCESTRQDQHGHIVNPTCFSS